MLAQQEELNMPVDYGDDNDAKAELNRSGKFGVAALAVILLIMVLSVL
jgi:hypothetical protein